MTLEERQIKELIDGIDGTDLPSERALTVLLIDALRRLVALQKRYDELERRNVRGRIY